MGLSLPVLFSAGLREIERIVFSAHHNFLRTGFGEDIRNVCFEGRVSAFVKAHFRAIHPYRCSVIHCSEVKNQPVPGK